MAFNVFLTVRTKRNATELRKIDLAAVLLAFILPFIQAFTYLFWRPNGKTVYGPATLWCWIAKESAIIRLVAFFVPIWCFVSIAIFFLALSGKQILRVRKSVKSAKAESALHREEPAPRPDGDSLPRERRFSRLVRAFTGPTVSLEPVQSVATTANGEQSSQLPPVQFKGLGPFSTPALIQPCEVLDFQRQLEEGLYPQESLYQTSTSSTPFGTWHPTSPTGALDRTFSDQPILQNNGQTSSRRPSSRFDRIHWKYAKFALLCTLVLFVTWVRSIYPKSPFALKPMLLGISFSYLEKPTTLTESWIWTLIRTTITGPYQR
ncbi:hypothetical protein A1O7_08861 [Cladophialophora yegresii CBS 114405]|uniref:G-protein coupled receptors family 2 profile 2 domain-containing protein n=1 Tax=Cladophialophora yegresii CBS 114405 TaxID=1182544 RepID=W9VSF9_9EURO|nr:uncharacterized protein A1O7_08861 [Cladophialophora yegresii CBS 114405]EXJ55930.1 hypothetical protein A1O7_08861 [Cladophialophora yegresii CBS 114405]